MILLYPITKKTAFLQPYGKYVRPLACVNLHVHAHLAKLEQKGLIQRNPAKQRSLVITEPQTGAAGVNVPLVGNVAAVTQYWP
jgi:hypothetical protein